MTIFCIAFTSWRSNAQGLKIAGYTEEQLKELYNEFREKQSFLELRKGLLIASFPRYVSLSSLVTVYIHPDFITTIKFPFDILTAECSARQKHFVVRNNILEVQANPDADISNVVVYYRDDKGQIRTMNILLKLLNPFKTNVENKIFFPQVVFVRKKILTPVEVLENYRKIYGTYPQKSYTVFKCRGNTYVIMKSHFGNVRAGDNNYIVKMTFLKP